MSTYTRNDKIVTFCIDGNEKGTIMLVLENPQFIYTTCNYLKEMNNLKVLNGCRVSILNCDGNQDDFYNSIKPIINSIILEYNGNLDESHKICYYYFYSDLDDAALRYNNWYVLRFLDQEIDSETHIIAEGTNEIYVQGVKTMVYDYILNNDVGKENVDLISVDRN